MEKTGGQNPHHQHHAPSHRENIGTLMAYHSLPHVLHKEDLKHWPLGHGGTLKV